MSAPSTRITSDPKDRHDEASSTTPTCTTTVRMHIRFIMPNKASGGWQCCRKQKQFHYLVGNDNIWAIIHSPERDAGANNELSTGTYPELLILTELKFRLSCPVAIVLKFSWKLGEFATAHVSSHSRVL